MSTPYDDKILIVQWMGALAPGEAIEETVAEVRTQLPNVSGIILHTIVGTTWLGALDDHGPKSVTGVESIRQWAQACSAAQLELHVLGHPRAFRRPGTDQPPDIAGEAERLIAAAKVANVA